MLQMGSICFSNATPAMLRAKVDGKRMLRESTQQWPGCGVNAGGRMKYLCGRPRDCGKTFDKVLYPRTPHRRRRHHHPSPFPLRLATGVTIFFAWFSGTDGRATVGTRFSSRAPENEKFTSVDASLSSANLVSTHLNRGFPLAGERFIDVFRWRGGSRDPQ